MKVGTIGTGFIVEWFLTSVARNENAHCEAVFSRKMETGKALADQFGIQKVYTNYEEMLKDDAIDTIYVASPNSLHYQYSKQALEAGKHVICEKPFTTTLDELKELSELARSKQLFLFEAIVTRHMPNYLLIRDTLPELGKIRMIQCNFSQYSSRYDKFLNNENPNVFNPDFSGGALMDLNIYNLHFVMGLFGKPNAAKYYPNCAENGIDTSGILLLTYDGFQAVCVACKNSASDYISQIQGENGYLRVDGPTSLINEVTLHLNKKEAKIIGSEEIIPGLYYEVKDFADMMERHDLDACYKELDHSIEVFEVLYHARIESGIRFKDDNKI